jgi:predicted DNA-binding protein (MmcQ/YjbR family)
VAKDPQHERLLAIVKSLPGAYEDWPWGSIHCKVDGKIFAGWGRDDDGNMVLGIRTDLEQQAALVESDPRFTIAKYVGKYGGIDMKLGSRPDWAEIEQFIVQSYRIMAPKKRVKELDAARGPAPTLPSRARAPAAKRRRR